jgi:hypothetical protein
VKIRLPRITPRVKWQHAAVFLFVLSFALAALSMVFTVHYYSVESTAQHRQGEQTERRLCTTLDSLGALRPPAGTAPSQVYLQGEHEVLAQLATDLGCPPVHTNKAAGN